MAQTRRPQRQQQGANRSSFRRLDPSVINEGGKALVTTAEDLGKDLARGKLTSSQIRNIYGSVKKMQMRGFDEHQFLMLKPKLAYAAKRANNDSAQLLKNVLTQAIDLVENDPEKFERFVDFFEAILAYHKAHGGS